MTTTFALILNGIGIVILTYLVRKEEAAFNRHPMAFILMLGCWAAGTMLLIGA